MKQLAALRAGDEAAFEKLCWVYSEQVRSLARMFVARNPASAHLKDDLVSEGVLAVVTTLRSLQSPQAPAIDSLCAYMATTVRNSFLTLVENEQAIRAPLRKRKTLKSDVPRFKQIDDYELEEIPECRHEDDSELRDCLKAACTTDAEFAAIQLRAEGLADDVIARCLRVSESTVRRMRMRVEQRYRSQLEGNDG